MNKYELEVANAIVEELWLSGLITEEEKNRIIDKNNSLLSSN